jgi:hypothetical protein
MKPVRKKKLQLSATTLRALTPTEMTRAAGGYSGIYDQTCGTSGYCATQRCVTNGTICTPSGQFICLPNSGQLVCV